MIDMDEMSEFWLDIEDRAVHYKRALDLILSSKQAHLFERSWATTPINHPSLSALYMDVYGHCILHEKYLSKASFLPSLVPSPFFTILE